MHENLTLAELDGLLSAGRISMDEYWRARVETERSLEAQSHEQAFDLAPRDQGADGSSWVSPPPRLLRPSAPEQSPAPLVPPAPAPVHGSAHGGGRQWIQLGFDAPSRDAAQARGEVRRRTRWWWRGR